MGGNEMLRQIITGALAISLGNAVVAAQGLEVRTLSSRPDMVSGGDALIEISSPDSALLDRVSAMLNGRTVTKVFRRGRTPGSLIGRVEGMALGNNKLEVKAGKFRAQLELINHPITGPVFAGPKQTPFVCQTEVSGLGAPLDADCSIKTVVTYYYKSTNPLPSASATNAPASPGRSRWVQGTPIIVAASGRPGESDHQRGSNDGLHRPR
jgi:uncharacterized tannase-like protein DUF6351